MPLRSLPPLLRDEPALLQVLGRSTAVISVADSARAVVLAGFAESVKRHPLVVAVPTTADGERISRDLIAFLGEDEVMTFPAWETLPFERVSPSVETMGQRLRVLWHLRDPERAPRIIVAPARALVQRLGPGADLVDPVIIGQGDTVDPTQLVEDLVAAGYRREYQVEARGEVAVRGSIVDVFPSTSDVPVRIDLWGDEVDRLTEFAIADQRATIDLAEIEIFPCRELLPTDEVKATAERLISSEPWGREQWDRLASGETFDGMESWLPWLDEQDGVSSPGRVLFDLLDASAQIVLVEPRRMRDRAADIVAEEADLGVALARTWGLTPDTMPADETAGVGGDSELLPRLHLPFERLLATTAAPAWTIVSTAEGPDTVPFISHGWDPVVGDGAGLVKQLTDLLADGYRVVVAADGAGSAPRVEQLLAERGLGFKLHPAGTDPDLSVPGGHIVVSPLERGAILPDSKLALLAESDVTGRRRAHRRARVRKARQSSGFFEDLKPGDFVVHHHHGVARYGGMVKRAIGGPERDYLLLEYRGGDKLYVPTDQIETIRLYTGGDSPSLSRMGGTDWHKAKTKVRSAVEEIAQELVVLYQQRVSSGGFAFSPDTPWQREMEDAFPFALTPDQARSVEAIKADMESDTPMDRLVVGDVGFGKTEIAIRAAFKAVQDGKQVAVLVPTTLLAQQHFQTFSERYAGYPVRVEVLSRFLTPAQARKVVQGLESGEVDVIIGTHRLLSEDISFKQLGLLVVDEEQRFGVQHKENMKKLKTDVDVLTLTATPIPRTLEMSLTGIRDMSQLNTPPADRQPILTYVGEYDERAVAEAIRRELLREGQVFFVHNRVQDIEMVARDIGELVPEARVAIAHGQMDEGSLESVVFDFWEGKYDVLVCTTIIESGIDMPTVNTLVVDRADRLGLGQLHQLRGRVGRAGSRAYAYLFSPEGMSLSEQAYERLKTIGDATELGSGFRIAMRDLEIRGAGNLLGTGQSGHIAAVGYDLYCQMVTEVVSELKGETAEEAKEIKLEVPVDAHLPVEYMGQEDLRLEAYRRLATVTSEAEVNDIRSEWEDRYGAVPEAGEALLSVARLRAECVRTGVDELVVSKSPAFSGPKYLAKMEPLALKTSQQLRLNRLYKGSIYKEDQRELQLAISSAADAVDVVIEFLRTIVPIAEEATT